MSDPDGDRTADSRLAVTRETRDMVRGLKRGGETYDQLLRKMAEQYDPERGRSQPAGRSCEVCGDPVRTDSGSGSLVRPRSSGDKVYHLACAEEAGAIGEIAPESEQRPGGEGVGRFTSGGRGGFVVEVNGTEIERFGPAEAVEVDLSEAVTAGDNEIAVRPAPPAGADGEDGDG